jgi:mannitol/fructose-specific phosphotransferase system IIA component (Ntr-type)
VVDASRKVWEREQLGSTFFNEGVAFPHARLDGLSAPRIALGLTRHGIVDVAAKRPIEVVFLILSPAESPTAQLQMLALTSRAAQDRHFLKRLQMAKSPESVLETIADWEGSQ